MSLEQNTTMSLEQNTATYGLQQPSRAGKIPKPVMEKRRRARINRCLEELKGLVPDLTISGARVDKADVLEMTVEHLTKMRQKRRDVRPPPAAQSNPHQQFSQGYQQCMAEVTRLMMSSSVDQSVTSKLVDHLTQRSAAPIRQFNFINIPQHQIKPELPKMPQLSTPQMPQLSALPQSPQMPHLSPQLPYTPQFSSYPSPPNSPDSSPASPLQKQSPIESPQSSYPVHRLPSVARRPQSQRAPAVWRPW